MCSYFMNVKYEVSKMKEVYRNVTNANYYFVYENSIYNIANYLELAG